ncbi:MAG: UbiD family decarboxylase, partial [Moorella sp. (in: Bacteria)]|nr:UbiD family decarboxylase [Moorella sp. (in: firmicutes)]
HILPGVREPEGPFAEYTGYSTSRSTRNVFEVTALCRRRQPVYLSVVPGPSADHLHLMRVAKEASVLQRMQEKIPWVQAISYPKSGVNFHCYLSLARAPEGVARHALLLLFGLDPYPKLAVIVDDDVDVNDEEAVWWAVATRSQGDRDIMIIPGVFTSPLDPSSEGGMAAKVGIDATMKEKIRKEVMICRPLPEHLNIARELIK